MNRIARQCANRRGKDRLSRSGIDRHLNVFHIRQRPAFAGVSVIADFRVDCIGTEIIIFRPVLKRPQSAVDPAERPVYGYGRRPVVCYFRAARIVEIQRPALGCGKIQRHISAACVRIFDLKFADRGAGIFCCADSIGEIRKRHAVQYTGIATLDVADCRTPVLLRQRIIGGKSCFISGRHRIHVALHFRLRPGGFPYFYAIHGTVQILVVTPVTPAEIIVCARST